MKSLVKILSVVTALVLSLASFSCKNKGSAIDLYYFNSPVHVQTQGKVLSSEDLQGVKDLLSSLQKEFDLSSEESTLSVFNGSGERQPINLSKNAIEVFTAAKDSYEFTDGKFNPAIYPVIKLWKFSSGFPSPDFAPPTDSEISAILNSGVTDFDKVVVDKENQTAAKTDGNLSVDFGGIVKGYAAELVGEFLLSKGYDKGYLSIGSSSLYILESENLTVRHPRQTEELSGIIKIDLKGQKNLSVSTSGDYERYYIHNGKTYSHLIDPKTGYPAETGVISATVVGTCGAFSDAVTTALCTCSHQSSKTDSELILLVKKILDKYQDAAVFVVTLSGDDKEILTNKTEGEDFTLLDKDYSVVKI